MSKIEWTDETWNPIAGCSDVSEGCRNCYARGMAKRLEAMGQEKYKGLTVMQGSHNVWTGKISFDEDALLKPLSWKKPRRIFVNSMSDLFHENVTDDMRDKIFAVMSLTPQHEYQVLTKRPSSMLKYLTELRDEGPTSGYIALAYGRPARFFPRAFNILPLNQDGLMKWPLANVRLGTSVENQKAADDRLDYLCELGSQRWNTMVSFEPLLGPVDPGPWWLSLGKKTWAIVGGESGSGARPLNVEWIYSLAEKCKASSVPVFVKQLGQKPYSDDFAAAIRRNPFSSEKAREKPMILGYTIVHPADNSGTKYYKYFRFEHGKGGDMAEWPEDLQIRQFPERT